MALAAGDKLGPYEILAPVGSGGKGEVWKARDTRLDRIVAVKRLKGGHSARFEQEARTIAALNHPHICQILPAEAERLEEQLRSQMYTGLVGLTFAAEDQKATLVEHVCKARFELNGLTIRTTLRK